MDFEAYSEKLQILENIPFNIEILPLYLFRFFFFENADLAIKVISIFLYLYSMLVFIHKYSDSIASKYFSILLMFALPWGFLAATSIFRQSLALSFMLLTFVYSRRLGKFFLYSGGVMMHLSSLFFFLVYFFRNHLGFVLFSFVLAFSIISQFDFGIYNSYKKLNYSTSNAYFMVGFFLIFSIITFINKLVPFRSTMDTFLFVLVGVFVIFGYMPADLVTRVMFYMTPFVCVRIGRVVGNLSTGGRIMSYMFGLAFFLILAVGSLDRSEYHIPL